MFTVECQICKHSYEYNKSYHTNLQQSINLLNNLEHCVKHHNMWFGNPEGFQDQKDKNVSLYRPTDSPPPPPPPKKKKKSNYQNHGNFGLIILL